MRVVISLSRIAVHERRFLSQTALGEVFIQPIRYLSPNARMISGEGAMNLCAAHTFSGHNRSKEERQTKSFDIAALLVDPL